MDQIDYISLIHKQLSNEITDADLAQLNEWLAASEDNELTAEAIKVVWEQANYSDTQLEALAVGIEADVEFLLLDKRINADNIVLLQDETDSVPVIKKTKPWLMVASIALLLGLGSTLIVFINENKLSEFKTGDQPAEILLADGSVIHLNANSTLKYPENLDGKTREVEFEGEAFFDIAKDAKHPFIIHTPYEDVTVLGTSFNIRAYSFEPNSEIAVATGKVQVNSGMVTQVVLPNEIAIVDHSSSVLGVEKTESLNETAWLTKTIHFSNTSVVEVFADLESYYNVEFIYDANLIGDCLLTSTFKNDPIETVLETISTVLNVTIEEKTNSVYTLIGGGCQ